MYFLNLKHSFTLFHSLILQSLVKKFTQFCTKESVDSAITSLSSVDGTLLRWILEGKGKLDHFFAQGLQRKDTIKISPKAKRFFEATR